MEKKTATTASVFVAALILALPQLVLSTRPPDGGGLPVLTTVEDYFMPGTQPDPAGVEMLPIVDSLNCVLCHASFDPPLNVEGEPFRNWAGSMMAQASRDPVFYAALTVANQDALYSGDLCLRCHAPAAWLGGRCFLPDGSQLLKSPWILRASPATSVTATSIHSS